jgi:hypothetical protein
VNKKQKKSSSSNSSRSCLRQQPTQWENAMKRIQNPSRSLG